MKSLLIIDILGSTRYYLALKLKIRNYFFLFEKNIYLRLYLCYLHVLFDGIYCARIEAVGINIGLYK